jgi:hypothetical protein
MLATRIEKGTMGGFLGGLVFGLGKEPVPDNQIQARSRIPQRELACACHSMTLAVIFPAHG